MKKVCVIGCFGMGLDLADGQTVKTRIVSRELSRVFGKENVIQIDTYGGIKKIIKLPFLLFGVLTQAENIVMLPAEKGLRVITPILVILNKFFNRKLFYDVIGGWLPSFLKKRTLLRDYLKLFDAIYVETYTMRHQLKEQGFNNVDVIPNCKDISIISAEELKETRKKPYKLCTFSRVMKEKGIEDAIEAVIAINEKNDADLFELCIYGQIAKGQELWFENLKSKFPEYIRYKGVIKFDSSTDELKQYDALLFPTYYEGEGFAGTIIDAFASGVPVIASDWKYNSEIIDSGRLGIIIKVRDINDLIQAIESIAENPSAWNHMKRECLCESVKYIPKNAMAKLVDAIR